VHLELVEPEHSVSQVSVSMKTSMSCRNRPSQTGILLYLREWTLRSLPLISKRPERGGEANITRRNLAEVLLEGLFGRFKLRVDVDTALAANAEV